MHRGFRARRSGLPVTAGDGTEEVGAASEGSKWQVSEVTVRDGGLPEVAGAGERAEMWALLWEKPPWPVDHVRLPSDGCWTSEGKRTDEVGRIRVIVGPA